MKAKYPQIKPMGDRAILIEFDPKIDEKLLEKLLNYKKIIENELLEEKVEVINTYYSLLVIYPSTIENIYDEISGLNFLIYRANIGNNFNSRIFKIPVCYDEEFGLDLAYISKEKNIEISEIVKIHSATLYTVFFIGFLPGFLYLGGLDDRLQISRKSTPRIKVPKGGVGIGENQTGIYPKSSPGGWQIIGNSPITFFDKKSNPPCIISPGDKVKFYSISNSEYLQISKEIEQGKFQLKQENYVG